MSPLSPAPREPRLTTLGNEAVPIAEACRRLAGIHRATFYRLPYFRSRRVRMSGGRVGILVRDIDAYLDIQASQRRAS